ncbi:MAG: hypothetical protein KGS72_21145 [Cyanobacteria bacterium REEB67]|nr:hypothetical protein [Cyanobacteria bacterium REEB67]
MKYSICLVALVLSLAAQAADSEKSAIIPEGTKFDIALETSIDSKTTQNGAPIKARLLAPLSIDGKVVLPSDTIFMGIVSIRFSRTSPVLQVQFNDVLTPKTEHIPIVTDLVCWGGELHVRRGMSDVCIDVSAQASCGPIGSPPSQRLQSVRWKTIYLMAKRGRAIEMQPGDQFKIQIAEDCAVPF